MNLDHFRRHLIWAEERRTKLYDDKTGEEIVLPSGGKITGGVGWNFSDRGIPPLVIDQLLELAINDAVSEAGSIAYWARLNDARQIVIADMLFNLGMQRFRRFVKFNTAMELLNYEDAADEMQDSTWYEQVPRRAVKLVAAMRSGVWVEETT
jgi:lysozyme